MFEADRSLTTRKIGGEKSSAGCQPATAPDRLPMRHNARKHLNGYSVEQLANHPARRNRGERR